MVSNGKGTPGTGQESIVFLVSGVLLAHQIVLLRQLALAQWAHVGYLVVGVALAGFGVAGVAVAQWGKKIVEHGSRATSASTVLFAASLLGGYLFLHWFQRQSGDGHTSQWKRRCHKISRCMANQATGTHHPLPRCTERAHLLDQRFRRILLRQCTHRRPHLEKETRRKISLLPGTGRQ